MGLGWSRPRVRTRMSVSRAHAHAGLARARALIARLFFLAQVNENDVSAAARLRTLLLVWDLADVRLPSPLK